MSLETDNRGNKKWHNENMKLHRDNDLSASETLYGDKY
jgi:hypothetical protein